MKGAFASITALLMSTTMIHGASPLTYPEAPKDNTVDVYFGMTVADPYRPLEDDTSEATAAWVDAENTVTRGYLDAIPYLGALRTRIADLYNYGKMGMPFYRNDGKYYYYYNDGLRNQSVLYRKSRLDGKEEVFLDPNKLSDDGTVALKGTSMSKNGRYTAYIISRSGSDWEEIYVMDTKSKKLLKDHIVWAKFTGASWDGDGFYYSAYPRPEGGREVSQKNEGHNVYYHKIGTPQDKDILVYEDPANPLHFHHVATDDEEQYLILDGSGEGLGNSLMIKKLGDPSARWLTMVGNQDDTNAVIDIRDGKVYVYTTWGAPRGRVMVADPADPAQENWQEFIAEEEGVLGMPEFSKDYLVVPYERDACSHIYLHNPTTGKRIREIKLPTFGTAAVSVSTKVPDIFYSFSSFTSPSAVYKYDPETDTSTLVYAPEIKDVNFDDYVTEQVFFPSTGGARVPMFITYKKGLKKDGTNPVYLYGYGGFNISLPPAFSAQRMLWLENGGIYAQACLRGGAEYGEEWHQAGIKENKLNVFNDFIGGAEYLISEGWTTKDLLVAEGASNGGLLVGACVNMRPDLFKVALPRVGVMDMMRYHLFTIGWNWASDYGTSADSESMARYLLGYSPIHNIRNTGVKYPAIMVTTADHDDRVVPAHSFKYAAALQAANTGDAPKLIRIDSKAGHGGGKPISKVIDEYADIYAFIFYNLGMDPTK